ncbi:MAG: hypothetical protein JO317_09365 [Verrucomicrobiae bacterium]|nr:hypothetical protein [Verrucomicrobiae bacterium]
MKSNINAEHPIVGQAALLQDSKFFIFNVTFFVGTRTVYVREFSYVFSTYFDPLWLEGCFKHLSDFTGKFRIARHLANCVFDTHRAKLMQGDGFSNQILAQKVLGSSGDWAEVTVGSAPASGEAEHGSWTATPMTENFRHTQQIVFIRRPNGDPSPERFQISALHSVLSATARKRTWFYTIDEDYPLPQ